MFLSFTRSLTRGAAGLALVAAVVGAPAVAVAAEGDAGLPDYQQANGVSGSLNSIGSDTLNNLMTFWAEGFQAVYPNVDIQIEGKGSSTAPPALTEGTAQLGPMSREMKKEEIDAFEKAHGYKPTAIKVAIDALAVFVHKDNPVKGLTLQQLDSAFSSSLKFGGKNANTWADLGLTGDWAGRPLSLYGRNSASGTYGYFKENALKKGDYKPTVKEQPGSSAVVQGVASDLGGIGYSGIGYITSGVKAISLGEKADKLVEPTQENCLNGTYPLSRFLFVYVNKKPGQPLDTLTLEFIKFIKSKQGQEIVAKDGYYPLPKAIVDETLSTLTK